MTKTEFKKVKPGSKVRVLETHQMVSADWNYPTKKVLKGAEFKVLEKYAFQARVTSKNHYLIPSKIELIADTPANFDKELEEKFSTLKKEIKSKESELVELDSLIDLRAQFPKLDIQHNHVKIYGKIAMEFPGEEDEKLIKLAIKLSK